MTIITDTLRVFSDAPAHKFSSLISDLKKNLKNPSISQKDKVEIAARIAAIESAGSARVKDENIQMLVYSVYELGLSCLLGPVGAGIGTLTISHRRRNIQANQKKKIRKAENIGGRRVGRKKHRNSRSHQIDRTSVAEGVSSYVQGLVWVAAMVPVGAITSRAWSGLKFCCGY